MAAVRRVACRTAARCLFEGIALGILNAAAAD